MFDDIKLPAKPVFEIPSQLQDLFKNNFQANQPAQEREFNKAVPQTQPLPSKPTPTAQTPKITTQMGSTLPHAKGLPLQRTPFHATLGSSKHSISSRPSHVISHRPILQPIDHRHDNKIVKQSSDSDMQSIRSTSSRMFGINTSDSGASRHEDDDTSMTASESRSRQSSKLPVVWCDVEDR